MTIKLDKTDKRIKNPICQADCRTIIVPSVQDKPPKNDTVQALKYYVNLREQCLSFQDFLKGQ